MVFSLLVSLELLALVHFYSTFYSALPLSSGISCPLLQWLRTQFVSFTDCFQKAGKCSKDINLIIEEMARGLKRCTLCTIFSDWFLSMIIKDETIFQIRNYFCQFPALFRRPFVKVKKTSIACHQFRQMWCL